jgi:hypothetical protein
MTGKKIVTDWLESRHGCFYGRHEVVGEPCLADAIDAALAAERKRCAKEIEITGTQWGGKDWNTAIKKCAAAIRALEVT